MNDDTFTMSDLMRAMEPDNYGFLMDVHPAGYDPDALSLEQADKVLEGLYAFSGDLLESGCDLDADDRRPATMASFAIEYMGDHIMMMPPPAQSVTAEKTLLLLRVAKANPGFAEHMARSIAQEVTFDTDRHVNKHIQSIFTQTVASVFLNADPGITNACGRVKGDITPYEEKVLKETLEAAPPQAFVSKLARGYLASCNT